MQDVLSLGSASPASSKSNSNSSWESVALSPLELISVQLEHGLQQLQEAAVGAKQNKNGVDIDAVTRKALGRLTIQVASAQGLQYAMQQNPLVVANAAQLPSVFVSSLVTPPSSCEKTVKRHVRTATTSVDATTGNAQWGESLVVEGIKSKYFVVKVAVTCSTSILSDAVIGELELNSADFIDQQVHHDWYVLKAPAASLCSSSSLEKTKLQLRVQFKYSALAQHEQQLAALLQKKKEHEEYIELFKRNAPLIQSHKMHPAAYGNATARSALYIPGNQFNIDAHHPGAVSVMPLPDKSRVVTPFGRGVVISFREATKMYVIQLDATQAVGNSQTLAFLRQDVVKEEPNEPHYRMHMKVATPYGEGEIEELRHDGVVIVQAPYARLFMQKADLKLPQAAVAKKKAKDFIDESIAMTEQGNEQFRKGECDNAVYSYLRALGFLQGVDQETATHKEKAMMLQTMIRCHLNIGACKLKVNAFADAEIACTNALSILTVLSENRVGNVAKWMGRLGLTDQQLYEEWPAKARFRRAQACIKLDKYVEAKQDLTIAVKLNPKDKTCRALLESVTKGLNRQKNQEKKTWGGIFGNADGEGAADEPATEEEASAPAKPMQARVVVDEPKEQREVMKVKKHQAVAQTEDPWYLSGKALATASLVTAGMAFAMLALKQSRS
ncbi:TPA: hypothetical protein N0F65_008975 [Lagenidium giganteum]|uniref:peptidylprolyl isomerase n=1 Tax=Lagenidium giganteum TaxID=4803 RepID=A0AAV2YJ23_9STRA|nr:TPA: hypothetical protein N0F65_008975 [Lagenidium giganteum]